MTLDQDICYRALVARDTRFDGVFFVGVKTTGVYCRPICPARTPGSSRCQFFARAAEAERAGYRACFRCRPELAPGLAPIESPSRLVQRATAKIASGYLNGHSIEELAQTLGVSSRHLRRAMEAELGVSPVELAQTQRLAMAKRLLHDTALSPSEIAFASGFASLRRFNALIKQRWGRSPSSLRTKRSDAEAGGTIELRLDYRPPLHWSALLGFLAARAISGVEAVTENSYQRTVQLPGAAGVVQVRPDDKRAALHASLSASLASRVAEVVPKLRALFDLDARPDIISRHLQADARLQPLVSASPGLRVPGAFDGFETAVRAVLGQQVSVKGATTLCGRLVQRFGAKLEDAAPGTDHLFPTASSLSNAALADIRAIGLPQARARTILELARAVHSGHVDLAPGAPPEELIARLQEMPGVGPWTAHYLAMRVLRWPDAFPGGDLAVCRALGVKTPREAERRVQPWQPWRSYGVMHLWNALSQGG
jgi:AraC family transcriptional regulator of adaptative response / DNA-3-methyladenine glycosylase II